MKLVVPGIFTVTLDSPLFARQRYLTSDYRTKPFDCFWGRWSKSSSLGMIVRCWHLSLGGIAELLLIWVIVNVSD